LNRWGAPTQRLLRVRGEHFGYSGAAEDRETRIFDFDTSGQLLN